VQILRGRLALIIENFKAYLLALSQIGKAGLSDRREVNNTSAPPVSVFMNP